MSRLDHLRTAGSALKHWFIATCYDAAAVALMWFVGLLIVGVPWAIFWALLGGAFQFIPNLGPVFALAGPALALLLSGADAMKFVYLLIVYAIIIGVDGLFLQPYLMKRSNKVPIWASILAPIVLGILIPFCVVLLAPRLLAVVYAFRAKARTTVAEAPNVDASAELKP